VSEKEPPGTPDAQAFSLFQEVDPLIGTTIDERFRILECIGRGSLSVAYKARDTKAGELRVLKKVHKHISDNIRNLKALEVDLKKMLTNCQSEHLTSYVDVFVSAANDLYLISPSTPQVNLESVLTKAGRLALPDALSLATSSVHALCDGHKLGYLHKSMKPSNFVYLDGEPVSGGFGAVKLADFGVAQLIANHSVSKSQVQFMTHGRETMGSPMYFSPEMCQGASGDARSDIYSFACVMYEVLTGKPPFVGKNAIETAYKHLKDDPAPMNLIEWQEADERLCKRMESIIDKCLKKEPENRYQKAIDLELDLNMAQSASDEDWQTSSVAMQAPQKLIAGKYAIPKFSRNTIVLPIVAAVGLLVGITALWLFFVTNNFNSSMSKYPPFNENEMWLVVKKTNATNKESFNARRDTALDALQLVRSEHGINSEDYAGALAALVELYANSGYWKEAQQRLTEMLDVTERVKGPWPKSQLYRILSYCQFMMGPNSYEDAEKSANESLRLMTLEKSPSSMTIQPLNILGDIASSKNEHDKAISAYDRLYQVVSTIKEEKPSNFCDTTSRLADVYRRRGDNAPAEKFYNESLVWWETHGKIPSLYATKSHFGLALVLAKQGKNAQAEEALSKAMRLAQNFPGKKSALMGAIKRKYVELLWRDKPLEAIKLCLSEKS